MFLKQPLLELDIQNFSCISCPLVHADLLPPGATNHTKSGVLGWLLKRENGV